jgi:hypothetical protein
MNSGTGGNANGSGTLWGKADQLSRPPSVSAARHDIPPPVQIRAFLEVDWRRALNACMQLLAASFEACQAQCQGELSTIRRHER